MNDVTDAAKERKAAKEAEAEKRREAATRAAETKLRKAQTVIATVAQTNGQPLHLCQDQHWRTDTDLRNLTVSED